MVHAWTTNAKDGNLAERRTWVSFHAQLFEKVAPLARARLHFSKDLRIVPGNSRHNIGCLCPLPLVGTIGKYPRK